MKETKIYCDHCGKELDEMHDYTESQIETPKSCIQCDLCKDCTNLLDNLIDDFLTKGQR